MTLDEITESTPLKGVLFNQAGDAVRLRLADGTEKHLNLRYRMDVEGVEPLVHGLLTMAAATVEALERVGELEGRLMHLRIELERVEAQRARRWWQRLLGA